MIQEKNVINGLFPVKVKHDLNLLQGELYVQR